MSIYVLREVLEHSQSEHGARLVAIALAEGASKEEGITWISQAEIARLTLLEERAVRDAIRWLEDNVEIETRKAQRGRRRINVYRLLVGRYALVDAAGDDLPFTLNTPFSLPADIAGRRIGLLAERMEGCPAGDEQARPADIAGREEPSRPADIDADDRQFSSPRPANFAALSSLQDFDPSENQEQDPSAGAAAAEISFPNLAPGLKRLGVAAEFRMRALADPERATAWLEVARKEARANPAGMFVTGFESGEWPSARGREQAAGERRRISRERSLEQLVRNSGTDEARHMVDVEWDDLTSVERAELHELIDELASDQLPVPIAAPAATEAAGAA